MVFTYARIITQNRFKCHILFSAGFYKINGEDQKSDEFEMLTSLNINRNLTESDISNVDVKSQLEHQIQIQETEESEWMFDKNYFNGTKIL